MSLSAGLGKTSVLIGRVWGISAKWTQMDGWTSFLLSHSYVISRIILLN